MVDIRHDVDSLASTKRSRENSGCGMILPSVTQSHYDVPILRQLCFGEYVLFF